MLLVLHRWGACLKGGGIGRWGERGFNSCPSCGLKEVLDRPNRELGHAFVQSGYVNLFAMPRTLWPFLSLSFLFKVPFGLSNPPAPTGLDIRRDFLCGLPNDHRHPNDCLELHASSTHLPPVVGGLYGV